MIYRDGYYALTKQRIRLYEKYVQLVFDAEKLCTEDSVLYTEKKPYFKKVKGIAIPYYLWGNRGKSEMRVWIHNKFS